MKVNINNYICHKDKGIIKVLGIVPHCGDYKIETIDGWVYLKNCKPIKLTDEILAMANITCNDYFEKGNGVYWFTGHNPNVPIQFVHEFQNLYVITKEEELNIKLT